jgi:hypothetical protein
MGAKITGSLDAPPIVVRPRRRIWSLLFLPFWVVAASGLAWGVAAGELGLFPAFAVVICVVMVWMSVHQLTHSAILTISPEGIEQRTDGRMQARRWSEITGLAAVEDEYDELDELGIEATGAETLWLAAILPLDRIEHIIMGAQARWAPHLILQRGARRRIERQLLAPVLGAILVFAASIAAGIDPVREFLGMDRLDWPWWLASETALLILAFRVRLTSRATTSEFVAWLVSWLFALWIVAMFAAVIVLGINLWAAALALLALPRGGLTVFYGWIRWAFAVLGWVTGGSIGAITTVAIGRLAWERLALQPADSQ